MATFVYDGDCAFCSTCARFIERRIPTSAAVVAWQRTDLNALGLTADECEQAVQWVSAEHRASGPDAIARLLQDAGSFWRLPGWALRLPPVRRVAWPAYRWVARHRDILPGGTATCVLPQSDRPQAEHDRLAG
jgi:predicted DCC family thiol-disulfide oxidoreductase YuxK